MILGAGISLRCERVRQRTRTTLAIHGPILRCDLPGLYRRVCDLLARREARVLICDVHGVEADAVSVDALARLALAARRYDCQVRLRGASKELSELVSFMGLDEVLFSESAPESK
jgi:ABC-type transporter Mla MlaB component